MRYTSWHFNFMSAGDVNGYTHTNTQNSSARQWPDRIAGHGRSARLRILVAAYLATSRVDARNLFACNGHTKFNVGGVWATGWHGSRPARCSTSGTGWRALLYGRIDMDGDS